MNAFMITVVDSIWTSMNITPIKGLLLIVHLHEVESTSFATAVFWVVLFIFNIGFSEVLAAKGNKSIRVSVVAAL